MRTCMVWNMPFYTGQLGYGAHIGTALTHNLIPDTDAVLWMEGEPPPPGIEAYDIYIVTLFAFMDQITQLRKLRPNAVIVALPDGLFESLLLNCPPHTRLMFFDQLRACDAIAAVSPSNFHFYASFDLPVFAFPCAIGTDEFFADIRQLAKTDTIICTDHGIDGHDTGYYTAAVATAVQKKTSFLIQYPAANAETIAYLDYLGARYEAPGKLAFDVYCKLAAQAWIGIDLSPGFHLGRNAMALMYAGTPVVNSQTHGVGIRQVEPFRPLDAVETAMDILNDEYEDLQAEGVRVVQYGHSFKAAAARLNSLIHELELLYHAKQTKIA